MQKRRPFHLLYKLDLLYAAQGTANDERRLTLADTDTDGSVFEPVHLIVPLT